MKPLIELRKVTLRPFRAVGSSLYNLNKSESQINNARILPGTDWSVFPNQNWLVVGPNGSGKSTLVSSLCGRAQVIEGKIVFREDCSQNDIGFISIKNDTKLLELIRKVQESGCGWNQLTNEDLFVNKFLFDENKAPTSSQQVILESLGLTQLLEHHLSHLSTGQVRKLSLAKVLMNGPKICILDEPFDGLDVASTRSICEFLSKYDHGQLIVISHRLNEIVELPMITHILEIGHNNEITSMGKKDFVLSGYLKNKLDHKALNQDTLIDQELIASLRNSRPLVPDVPLISMQNITVRFDGTDLIKDLTWTIHSLEHWSIVAPNGSGKSTLLELISGENSQVHSNDILFWGHSRDALSLVQVRSRIGIVTAKIQVSFQQSHQTVLRTICSAFHGIVGGYCPPVTDQQLSDARLWAKVFGIEHLLSMSFSALSQGQQRLVLWARSLVANPDLLLLDEPFHGLDSNRRKMLLDILETLKNSCTILIVSHHHDEIPHFISRQLQLDIKSGHAIK